MKSIVLNVNGRRHTFVVDKDRVLLDILRDDLGLTGTKQGCDRKGQCGACTVIVNDKAVLSCLVKAASLDGARVITVEGLGTPDNPHLIQHAYVLSGAIQCGYCTPGMIMATKVLLDADPDPSVEDIKKALRRNLCRCTGYKKIIEAVQLAGRFVRGETTPDEVRPKPTDPMIGVSHPRPTSLLKACGCAQFGADIRIPGALELAVLRSTVPHARIVSIDAAGAEKMAGVAGVMTAADILGTNIIKNERMEVLCRDKVHFIGDPVVAVAADTREHAEAAVAAVKVDLEPLPVLDNATAALAEDAVRVHPDVPNLCFDAPMIRGDAEQALRESAAVVEARFSTQISHMAPLEQEACVSYWEDADGDEEPILVVVGRSINIHADLDMLQEALGWENMTYIEAFSGGHFGIKSHITSDAVTAAAALHFKRPVRYIPSLTDSMLMTPKTAPFEMDVKLGADADGHLSGYCNEILVDKGPYFVPHTIGRALKTLSGSYYIPNVKARGRMAYTNNPWGGASRGNGQPQVSFALECSMEMLAEKLGIDPFEFRLMNSLQPGQAKSSGHVPTEWPFPKVMEAIRPHYERAVKEAEAHRDGPVKWGVGLGAGAHGVGMTAEGAVAAVGLDADGGVTVYAAAADPGEGNDSMLTQLTAEYLDIPFDKVRLRTRCTDDTAASGPAAGSRITFMIGGALMNALEQLKSAMDESGAKTSADLEAAGKQVRYVGKKANPGPGAPEPGTGQGPSYVSEIHGVQLVELAVDTASGEVTIRKITTAVDAGTVLHPQNLTGQLEGGMDMGVGYALREEYVAGETRDWVTFKFPKIEQSFEMETILVETPRPTGPYGATGVGEMCLVPTAPAVINAIHNATGAWVCDLPATPDKVKAALTAIEK
jgi:aldehyde oxidoreductase